MLSKTKPEKERQSFNKQTFKNLLIGGDIYISCFNVSYRGNSLFPSLTLLLDNVFWKIIHLVRIMSFTCHQHVNVTSAICPFEMSCHMLVSGWVRFLITETWQPGWQEMWEPHTESLWEFPHCVKKISLEWNITGTKESNFLSQEYDSCHKNKSLSHTKIPVSSIDIPVNRTKQLSNQNHSCHKNKTPDTRIDFLP